MERGCEPHSFPGELYNLENEPVQRRNVYGEYPDIVEEMKALLEKYKQDDRSVAKDRFKVKGI